MAHWSEEKERSNVFWLSALAWSANFLGRGFLRILCVPIAFFFLATATQPRKISRDYLNRVLSRPATLLDTLKHFYTFALVSGDRLLFLKGKQHKFDLRFSGEDIVQRYANEGRGCMLVVSHVGSFDAMRVPAVNEENIPIRILIDKALNPAAISVIEKLNPALGSDMIDAGQPSSALVLSLNDALSAGNMVGVMVDRAAPGETLQPVHFLNETAYLPAGPWMLAMVLKVPIIMCTAVYDGSNRYRIQFTLISDGTPVPRRERQQQLALNLEKYVGELQHIVRSHPYNWFNFFNFWSDESSRNH